MPDVSEIGLRSGRHIILEKITQTLTYGGLLEGLPTSERNAKYLQWLVENDPSSDGTRAVLLIQPTETPIDRPDAEPYPFGSPARLPNVTCVALFHSTSAARTPDLDFSELTVIWLQDHFGTSVTDAVMNSLSEIKWEEHAHDFEF